MKNNTLTAGIVLTICLTMVLGLGGCGGNASALENEKLKKEIEDLKKGNANSEKAAAVKADPNAQQDALLKEKLRLEKELKVANAKKQPEGSLIGPEYPAMKISSPDGFLNLRSGPSASSTILAEGNNDEWVEVIKAGGTWSKVRFNGKIGYMGTKFLTK
ncbi:MAG: SH3 domain-containing protein [Chloracidobacterium sp.]|nr:SH3 domain-containing protein [Chloracidobacterium sp.]